MKKDFKKVFFDTAPIIYYLDHDLNYFFKMKLFFEKFTQEKFFTSTVTCMEYLTYPYKNKSQDKIDTFYEFLSGFSIRLVNVTSQIADRAAYIKAKYNVRSMDALQLSAALYEGCEVFLTNDIKLARVKEIECLMVNDIS